jgi:hypothetical protein
MEQNEIDFFGKALAEKAAKEIYERHSFGLNEGIPIEGKPTWVPNGNSLKQGVARDYAREVLDVVSDALLKASRQ